MKKKDISRKKDEKSYSSKRKDSKDEEKTKGSKNKPKKTSKGKKNSDHKGKYFNCDEQGHWKRNCPLFLVELKKKKEGNVPIS